MEKESALLHQAALNLKHWIGADALLLKACKQGKRHIVEVLLSKMKNKINVNAIDCCKCTPLILACRGNHEQIVDLLLSQPDVLLDVQDENGFSA